MIANHKRQPGLKRTMLTLSLLGITVAMFASSGQPAMASAPHKKIAGVIVLPAQASLAINTLQWFDVLMFDDKGKPVNGRVDVQWRVSSPAGQIVQTTNTAALVRTGTQPGNYTNAVAVTVERTTTAYASINIAAASSNATIVVAPAVDTATVGELRLFTASAVDNQNNPTSISSVTWQVAPSAGQIQSSGPLTALVQMGGQPGFFQNVITASAAGATPGFASVVLNAGPPASVIVSPSSAMLAINATQTFTATVFDRFGNPLNLGVTWLAKDGVATIEAFTGTSAVVRAGTKAGVFADGVRAVQSSANGVVNLTILAGPPAGLVLSASPQAIKTDGQDSSAITAQVVDAYGNATGAGAQINLSVDACAGACTLLPAAGIADAQGRFAATLRNTNSSPTQTLTSQIKVAGVMQAGATTANASVTVAGSFTPVKSFLAQLSRAFPINNHTSCTALRFSPPATVIQPPNQPFNLYRFAASNASYKISLSNYASTGQLLLYRINNDQCSTSGTISVIFVRSSLIAAGNTLVTLDNLLVGGAEYLLAVQTTGAPSNVPYRLDITP
jgi:hypothetical protein